MFYLAGMSLVANWALTVLNTEREPVTPETVAYEPELNVVQRAPCHSGRRECGSNQNSSYICENAENVSSRGKERTFVPPRHPSLKLIKLHFEFLHVFKFIRISSSIKLISNSNCAKV